MKKGCVFTGELFSDNEEGNVLGPIAKEAIRKEIIQLLTNEPDLRKEVITAIVTDASVRQMIAQSVLCVRCTDVGLNAPGTIAEFFCGTRDGATK